MAIQIESVSYQDGEVPLTGHFVHEPGPPRPGVLVLHGGAGLDEHARTQARRFAEAGFAALACDLFGPGVAGDRQRVIATLTALRDDPPALRRRARAGLDALARRPEVDGRLAAVGYCFGGLTALELARSGAALAGAVSVHGTLETRAPALPGAVQAKLLVCHGGSDPHVLMSQVTSFAAEMTAAQADWQVLILGGAVHGFTHRDATGAMPGVAYHAAADARSWQAMRVFLGELFARSA